MSRKPEMDRLLEAAESQLRGRSGTIAGRVRVSFIPGLAATAAPDLADLQPALAQRLEHVPVQRPARERPPARQLAVDAQPVPGQ